MELGELLAGQYKQSHQILKGIVADVPPEMLNQRDGNGTAGSIGSIYAHIVMSQDAMLSKVLGESTLYESGGWAEKVGIEHPGIFQSPEWSAAVEMKPGFDAYADAVFARTESALGTFTQADLSRLVDGFGGGGQKVPVHMFVANIGIIHVNEHAGEIAALKGVHGLKGLGF